MHDKPFSQACENNKDPILQVLRKLFTSRVSVLEIGSGSGQHAVHFCHQLPQIHWQPSDRAKNIPGIKAWRNWAIGQWKLENLASPLQLDVNDEQWPKTHFDGIFTANSCHIMDWDSVQVMIPKAAACLHDNGYLCIYGPFNYPDTEGHMRYTSPGNASFDVWLKQRDPQSGIRDLPAIQRLAQQSGLQQFQDYPMPTNNRLLVWQK